MTARGLYHNGRWKNPIYYPTFSTGMRIDQSTGGCKLINELRIKLAADFYAGNSTNKPRTRPWERMRLFYKLNPTYLKFCQATLSKDASEYQDFTMELGDIFGTHYHRDRQAISFGVISHEFGPIYIGLRESFKEAVEYSMNKSSTCNPSERLDWWRKLKAERNVEHVKVIEPTAFLGTVPTHDADQVVKKLAAQYGGRVWAVKVTGLHLGPEAGSDFVRDPNFVREYQEFPLKGSL
jgi:hypothetical protein